jgi:hypothetical protein
MRISVTQDHIDNGMRGICDRCAIALAVKDSCGKYPSVTEDFVLINQARYYVSRRARKFIQNFDKGKKAVPSVFVFEKIGFPYKS